MVIVVFLLKLMCFVNCFASVSDLKSFLSVYQKVTDIKNLSLQFWLVAFAIMFFYNGIFPFMADAR